MDQSTPPILYEDSQYQIRPARNIDEVKSLWWGFIQEFGAHCGYYDLEICVNPSKSSGMLILIEKPKGRPIGHIVAIVNNNKTGWISEFVIDAAHRGKGMGRELFKAAMKDAGRAGVKFLGLDSVAQQMKTYGRRGFVQSPVGAVKKMIRPLVSREPLPTSQSRLLPGHSVIDTRDVPFGLLTAHDLKYTGFERPGLWSEENMFSRTDVFGSALVSKSPPTVIEHVKAWVLVRRCTGGFRVGPVYAEDAAVASIVLATTMKSAGPGVVKANPIPGELINDSSEDEVTAQAELHTQIWSGNPEAEKVFADLGWKVAGSEYYRMWVDGRPTEPWKEGGIAQKGVFAIFDSAAG